MTHSITLNLPDDVMEKIEVTAISTGRNIETLLEEWISHRVHSDDIMTVLMQSTSLPIYTPLGGEKTAQALWEYLQETNNTNKPATSRKD